MPLDCSGCALRNQPPGLVLPCQQGGRGVFRAPLPAPKGTRQIPLLHLLYEAVVEAMGPQPREARATWLQKNYSKATGKELMPRLVKTDERGVRGELRQMVGMLLAQKPHFLPVWAQLDREGQQAVAQSIAALLRGAPPSEACPTRLQAEMFRGTVHTRMEAEANRLHGRVVAAGERVGLLAQELDTLRRRQELVAQAVRELDGELERVTFRLNLVSRDGSDIERIRALTRQSFPLVFDHETGEPLSGIALDGALDLGTDTDQEREQALRAHGSYLALGQQLGQLHLQAQGLQGEGASIEHKRQELLGSLARAEERYDVFERAVFEYDLLRMEADSMSSFAQETYAGRLEVQKGVQEQAIQQDFGVQPENYADPHACQELQTVLAQSGVARQLYLFLHPLLKYTDDPVLRCRLVKYLAADDIQSAFVALDENNLVHPGPHASLGVFVINALVPGSYDDRHREMVQSDLGLLQQAMVEHGMDPTVRCHSCGSTAPSGRSREEAAGMWIRDHNPPTSLYALGRAVYRGKLGLPDYQGNGKANGQILLPQCRDCSKRQGALTSKVVKLIASLDAQALLAPQFDLRAWLAQRFVAADQTHGAAEWADFVRVALAPFDGWRRPADYSGALAGVAFDRLVTTGGAGSFAGIDEDLLSRLGVELGCHTCTDVDRQRDPFRNILWIADHQPPTSLVARGLMELPQVVYPHCWKCSETQAQLTRAFCRSFDGCFGDHKDTFPERIRDRAWQDLSA